MGASSMERLDKVHRTLDAALADGPWFFGDTLTVLDFLLGMQGHLAGELSGRSIEDYPNIARHQRALLERPSARRALDIHRAKVRERGDELVVAIEPEGW